jgi:hypothetical protein
MEHLPVTGWVYNFSDYRQMFDLVEKELKKKVLDFPGSLSSFNAEMHVKHHKVITRDLFPSLDIQQVKKEAERIVQQNELLLTKNKHRLKDASDLFISKIFENWHNSKELFLNDYEMAKREGRYLKIELLEFPFADHQFDIALCSDLLFHTQARSGYSAEKFLSELCRVALEVRAFPLLDETGAISQELGPILQVLQLNNFGVEIRAVTYEEQKGHNAMLRIWNKECAVENECTPS